GATLDLFFLGQQALELGVGLLDQGDLSPALVTLRPLGNGRHHAFGTRLTRLALLGLATAAAGGDDTPGPGLAGGLPDRHPRFLGDLVVARDLVGKDVALVDPHLHADPPEGGAGFAEAVVDVGPKGVERDPALAIPLAASHLGAAQPARALHPNALRSRLLGRLHRPLHGPPEAHPAGELVAHR